MFSGIHSLFFGKKHHRNHNQTTDDSAVDKSSGSENDFVVLERRHSDDPDVTPGLYPTINPGFPVGGNLPYGVSPSLPDLRPQNSPSKVKEGTTIDLLHGVPFEIASYIDIMAKEKDEKFDKFLQRTKDLLSDEVISDGYNYDFNLEQRILSEFQT